MRATKTAKQPHACNPSHPPTKTFALEVRPTAPLSGHIVMLLLTCAGKECQGLFRNAIPYYGTVTFAQRTAPVLITNPTRNYGGTSDSDLLRSAKVPELFGHIRTGRK